MVRQPPNLLSNVLRAISSLHEVNGSTVPAIVSEIRYSLVDNANKPRNVAMQVRRALKHAVDHGMVSQRAGRYRLTRKKISPELTEMLADSSRRQRSSRQTRATKRSRTTHRKRKQSEHDFRSRSHQHRQQQRRRRRQQRDRRGRRQSESRSSKSRKSGESPSRSQHQSPGRKASENAQERQSRPPTASSAKSNAQDENASHDNLDYDAQEVQNLGRDAQSGRRRRTRRRRGHNAGSVPRNQPDVVPTVQDEPMDSNASPPGVNNSHRNLSPRRRSVFGPNQDNEENKDGSDHQPTYFN